MIILILDYRKLLKLFHFVFNLLFANNKHNVKKTLSVNIYCCIFRRLLAEASLQALDLATSETAFVQCQDYHGIKLVKQLANIQDIKLKQAEVAVYFGDYVKAEKLYIEADRK